MVVIEDSITITQSIIENTADADDLEGRLEVEMHNSLCLKMKTSLHEMALLDIEPKDNGDFEVKASVVLMTTQDMLTALQRLATRLKEAHGFTDDQVGETLEIFESTKGF